MLFSSKYNFLYVHIAKTGGTSLRATLKRLLWHDPEYYPRFICNKLSGLFSHRLASKIPRHAHIIAAYEMLPRELFNSLFKFSFVRNPWDLQVSSWHHLKKERPHLVNDCNTFTDFIQYKLDSKRKYEYHLDTSIDLQSNYLVDLHRHTICDFVGRYENLEEDYQHICNELGIECLPLAHKRRASNRKSYQEYYDEKTKQLVSEYFREDIERFNYTFDG